MRSWFSQFRFDLRRELFRDESAGRLGGRAFDSRQQDEVTLARPVNGRWRERSAGRDLSGAKDAPSGESYLVTVPGRGYRLVGDSRRSHAADIVAKLFCGPDR